jgi:N-acyl amino acid synthase of PEP-CTERM/exosortase system
MDDIHALRFAVYCKEKAFLDASKYPDGKEYDEFDDHSVHFAAYNDKKEIIATVRLVIPNADQTFPFERFCSPFPSVILPPKGKVAEISRLIIATASREQEEKGGFSFTSMLSKFTKRDRNQGTHEYTRVTPVEHQSTSPRLLLGLFRKMYRYSVEHGITHWYASMEPPLERMLRRYHLAFHRISDPVDYYGPVSLYLGKMAEIEQLLEQRNPELLNWFRKNRAAAPKLPGID